MSIMDIGGETCKVLCSNAHDIHLHLGLGSCMGWFLTKWRVKAPNNDKEHTCRVNEVNNTHRSLQYSPIPMGKVRMAKVSILTE